MEIQRSNPKSCSFVSNVQGFRWLLPSGFADYNTLIYLDSSYSLCAPLSPWDTPQLWHPQHLLVSNTIQASLPQFHTMTSLGNHAGNPLSHAWPSQISFTSEKDPKALFTPVFFRSLRPEPASYWGCQGLLPAYQGAWYPPWITFAYDLLLIF